jgi:predicted flap endonuclease-1-like 5' DNA nuclease/predicted  nucleic acid-binding Zn-ribbon protein
MDKNPLFWGIIGALIAWIAEWIYDVYLWRRQQANDAPLMARASSAESQALSLRTDLDAHKTKLNAFDLQVGDLNSRLVAAQSLAHDKTAELEALNLQTEAQKQKLSGMVEKKTLDAAQAEATSAKAQLATANASLDALKPSAEKAANLEKELASTKANFQGAVQKSQLDAANAEITDLKARLLSYSNQTQEYIDSKNRIGYLESELNDLKTKHPAELLAANAKSSSLEAEVAKLKSDGVMLMTERLAPALARIEFLEAEGGKMTDASDSADLKAKLAALEVEHSELHAKISSNTDADSKIATLEHDKVDLVAKIAGLETEVASGKEFSGKVAGFVDKIAALERELASAKNAASHNAADMAGMKTQLQSTTNELHALKSAPASNQEHGAEPKGLENHGSDIAQNFRAPENRDRLEKIDGIGDVYEHRLNAAGIWSFEQLANMSAESIRSLIQPEDWQKIEPDKWVLEAAERAKAKSSS